MKVPLKSCGRILVRGIASILFSALFVGGASAQSAGAVIFLGGNSQYSGTSTVGLPDSFSSASGATAFSSGVLNVSGAMNSSGTMFVGPTLNPGSQTFGGALVFNPNSQWGQAGATVGATTVGTGLNVSGGTLSMGVNNAMLTGTITSGGTLSLIGANTYTSGVTIIMGTTFGTLVSGGTISNGTLTLNGANTAANTLNFTNVLNSTGLGGSTLMLAGGTLSNGAISLGGSGGTAPFVGPIAIGGGSSNAVSLTKTGVGTLILTGSSNFQNAMSGVIGVIGASTLTLVGAGTLNFGTNLNLATTTAGGLILNGVNTSTGVGAGTLTLGGSSVFANASAGVLTLNAVNSFGINTLNATTLVLGTSPLTLSGGILSGANNGTLSIGYGLLGGLGGSAAFVGPLTTAGASSLATSVSANAGVSGMQLVSAQSLGNTVSVFGGSTTLGSSLLLNGVTTIGSGNSALLISGSISAISGSGFPFTLQGDALSLGALSSSAAVATPEPTTLALAAVGVLALLGRNSRRRVS